LFYIGFSYFGFYIGPSNIFKATIRNSFGSGQAKQQAKYFAGADILDSLPG
jgi:hypothetical protein